MTERGDVAFMLAAACVIMYGAHPPGVHAEPGPEANPAEIVQELMKKNLTGPSGQELRMLTVEYAPGASSAPHRHDAQVFVYVLSGSVRMQVKGSPMVTLGPGQTFYEGREDEHIVSQNASRTAPAKILVFMVKDPVVKPTGDKAKRAP